MVGLAFENYYSAYSHFPSPSYGNHSWRIRCLPFVMASPMYAEYDFSKTWDSPSNVDLDIRKLLGKGGNLHTFNYPYGIPCGGANHPSTVSYLMITGTNAFGHSAGFRRKSEITDGLSETIAAAETSRDDIHWLSPVDFEMDTMPFTVDTGPDSISSDHPNGPGVVFADGEVYRLDRTIPPSTLKAMLTIDGGEMIDRQTLVRDGWLHLP
ncbi:hypothetical protein LF1_52380 [Rubripirellula obstinata]|uniref:DUF1559 domain-containing protein n=2 Tax=Rubripirellula obstinata TaxID=406547 RepID=A0A5B1CCH5_9BACT|nr:hypothetical protein LF1_52380 [Rubripirellula obstinata]